jgi:antagonist of KipI
MTLAIVRPGPFTTVQDLGRPGHGRLGVPPSGAADSLALRIANRLVGNPDSAAAIEFTLVGPAVRFETDACAALAGSRFAAKLDGRGAPHLESFSVRRGQVLDIGQTTEGARGVLAVNGGIDVPLVLGSRSTFVGGGFGGVEGRPLRSGDRLPLDSAPGAAGGRQVRRGALPTYQSEPVLRVVAGPQREVFGDGAWRTFLTADYKVSTRSDRVGVRLEGPALERHDAADLLPEGLAPGAIQVPGDGQPILLGADRPTTGGYTKIATVVTVDLWRAAQAKPGDRLRFVEVGVEAARVFYREQQEWLRSAIEDVA